MYVAGLDTKIRKDVEDQISERTFRNAESLALKAAAVRVSRKQVSHKRRRSDVDKAMLAASPGTREKVKGTCNYCGKTGHWARDCFKKVATEKRATGEKPGSFNAGFNAKQQSPRPPTARMTVTNRSSDGKPRGESLRQMKSDDSEYVCVERMREITESIRVSEDGDKFSNPDTSDSFSLPRVRGTENSFGGNTKAFVSTPKSATIGGSQRTPNVDIPRKFEKNTIEDSVGSQLQDDKEISVHGYIFGQPCKVIIDSAADSVFIREAFLRGIGKCSSEKTQRWDYSNRNQRYGSAQPRNCYGKARYGSIFQDSGVDRG